MGRRVVKPQHLSITIADVTKEIVEQIGQEVENRSQYRVANELRDAELEVMRGQRSGRFYKRSKSGDPHQASAPGEPPAWDSGGLARSFNPAMEVTSRNGSNRTIRAKVESRYASGKWLIGRLMEDGTKRIKKRPYKEKTIGKALPNILKIYKEPYGRS